VQYLESFLKERPRIYGHSRNNGYAELYHAE
jgi:hypothetical protein